MQTINKGDGTGTGDSVKQALAKTADNFAEVSDRLDDIEARGFPRKLRGWAGPVPGFPQPPSAKGSAWTGATRKGSHQFAAGSLTNACLLHMPSGKLLALGILSSALYAQIYTVEANGALTALGGVVQLQSGVATGQIQAMSIGPDLAVLLTSSSSNGSGARRIVLDFSTGAIVVSSDTALPSNRFTTAFASYNVRGLRSSNAVFGMMTEYASSNGYPVGAMTRQMSALSADNYCRDLSLSWMSNSGQYAYTTHDNLGTDSAVVVTTRSNFDGNLSAMALLVAVNDDGANVIDRIALGSGATPNPSVIALSPSRALVRPSVAAGAFTLDVVDGELQLLTTDVQTSGVLGRLWRAVCAQDSNRAVVFEQYQDATVPTILQIDEATGAITEAGTIPLVFGTSGSALPHDALKIGPDRIAIIGRHASASPQCLVEVWDLT
ncbi:hypothetical protein [Devosia faecipullorum]|uniref:hypothetical protein n=1 Tax=Devosia faecipullorum TaxID=2755039 RepID=UPI00187B4441|nr:hypothetical protein [Devosia faecipullorum]MBE7732172.1 hypothetical protein [Devosia faecipullorum]